MTTLACAVLCAACYAVDAPPAHGTQWTYRGKLSPAQQRPDMPAEPGKSFDLAVLVGPTDGRATRAYWLLSEQGQGGWPWFERFGEVGLASDGAWIGKQGPAVLYEFAGGRHVAPLASPWFAPEQTLSAGATWEANDLTYEVSGPQPSGERSVWTIDVRGPVGAIETIQRERDTPLVASRNMRVFMNQGTEYRLEMSLVASEQLAPEAATALEGAFEALAALRRELKRPPRSMQPQLTADERTLLAERLPELANTVAQGPLARLVRDAQRDLDVQAGRANAVTKLSERFVGQPVAEFRCEGLDGPALANADLADSVTLLHFWDYRDQPLEEPYGQVGYLEFLHSRRKESGVKVYGVAVDSRLNDPKGRKAALASMRKLRDFMNLSYPIVLDDGTMLKQLGDPRSLGADLPLYVVIARDGKIAHYHPGLHRVDRQKGLVELDEVIGKLVE